MGKLKPLAGILLIVAAVAGLIYWETTGREAVTTETVLTAAEDIAEGTAVRGEMFTERAVLKENLVEGALHRKDAAMLTGKRAASDLFKNQQLVAAAFSQEDHTMEEGKSVFRIEPGWISSRSSALRRGDVADFYDQKGEILLGTYALAFVRDSGEQEVTDIVGGHVKTEILARTASTAQISHVEIIATVEEYAALRAYIKEGKTAAAQGVGQEDADGTADRESAGQDIDAEAENGRETQNNQILIVQRGE